MKMKFNVLLLSIIKFSQCNWSCGYTQEWGLSFTKVTYDDKPGTMGQQYESSFESDHKQTVTVTVTATVGGMLPPKPGDILLVTSKVYAQLYVRRNEKILPESLLIVMEGEVSHGQFRLELEKGDTLDLFAGHVTTEKRNRDAYGSNKNFIPGGLLEDITFCIIKDN